ncbi:Bardet-Biedl syndrome 5 protein homolog [Tetranychus urticae]|uniref:Bardet-Biedl syndrome 5 protein homolog n=1 Tax=Tetranychus urticae TaxID=32264 RepID=UPI00077BFB83|nr:Bardet-Biedl syndrome 5 protein homolog [Tetranychus urticae]
MASSKPIELYKFDPLWQDRDLRFDATAKELSLRKGEKNLYRYDRIEDTKGNAGDEGRLTITNLRIIWQSKSKPRINLTIGLNCVISITSRNLHNKLRGRYTALHIMAKINGTRYEFVFTPLEDKESVGVDPGPSASLIFSKPDSAVSESSNDTTTGMNPRFCNIGSEITMTVSRVCKAYLCTKLFRDLKLRSAIFTAQGKQLKILSSEQIYNKFQGVWNLSSDQGNLGTMHVTNLRIVWHANVNELFNLSLPYIQVSSIRVRESKFGPALVIESSDSSGGYVLGFRIDPLQRLISVYNELCNLYNVHVTNPNYGVETFLAMEMGLSSFDGGRGSSSSSDSKLEDDLINTDYIDEGNELNPDVIASYLEDDSQVIAKDAEPIFCPQLGLAIEKIKDGYTLESLWNVIPQGS